MAYFIAHISRLQILESYSCFLAEGVPALIVALSIVIASSQDNGVHSYVHADLWVINRPRYNQRITELLIAFSRKSPKSHSQSKAVHLYEPTQNVPDIPTSLKSFNII